MNKDGGTTMSRSRNILLGAAALVAMTTAAGAAPIRIGMTFQELNNPYFVTMQKALRKAAGTIGATVIVTDAHHDVTKQISDVEDMLQQHIDILLLNPTDSTGIESAVQEAHKAGVIVVAIDANAAGPVNSFVGSKNYDAGVMSCTYLANAIGGSGNVAILDGIAVVPILERVRGCKDGLAKFPNVKIVDIQNGKQERDVALSVSENMIQAHPDLKGIFSVNDGGSMGVLVGDRDQRQGHQADLGRRRARRRRRDRQARLQVHRDVGAVPRRHGADRPRPGAGRLLGSRQHRAQDGADRREAGRRREREDVPLVRTAGRSSGEAGAARMTAILELRGIAKSFPGVKALSGIDLTVEAGEIHALLGENGAGKSTLMKILSGIYQPDEGRISVGGRDLRFADYHDAVAAGIGIVFQEFSLIPYLNAVENIFLGRERRRLGLLRRASMRAEAAGLFRRLGVTIDLDAEVRTLSVAQQQFIEIAKALALDARILILDEPTATLTPADAEHLFAIMRVLKGDGVAMIFISHHMEEIFEICDRITVLRDGRFIGVTPVADTDMDRLVQMMVGRRLEQSFPPKPPPVSGRQAGARGGGAAARARRSDQRVPSARGRDPGLLRAGGLRAHRDGHGGAGRRTRPRQDGAHQRRDGAAVEPGRRAGARARHPAGEPQDRGLITEFTIRDNISINNLGKYRTLGGFLDFARERTVTAEMMRQVGVKAPGMSTTVETLSGGNQQKVVLARWLNHHCRILFFDEPTRGIDVGAKAEIYALMRSLTARGYAIVMVSSELPEIVGMSDRVAVFREGRIVRTLEADDIAPAEIMRHATAGDIDELV